MYENKTLSLESVSDNMYKAIFENLQDGILLANFETKRFLTCNSIICNMLGYSEEEIAHSSIYDLHYEEDIPFVIEQFEKHLRRETQIAKNIPMKRKDGCIFYVDVNSAFMEIGGKPHVVGIFRDVNERKLVEDKLRQSEEKYRTLYESSSDAIMMLDETGFFDCNSATLQMFGISTTEEFTKSHPAQLSPPYQPDGMDSLTVANAKISVAFETGTNLFEWVHRRSSGEDFFANVLLTALTLSGKQVLQATVRDITRQKQQELKLQEALLLAEAGSISRSNFLSNITHELVTPLNSVIGFSQVLLDGFSGPLNDKQREYTQAILESGERLNESYSEILMITKLDSGVLALEVRPLLLKELLISCLAQFKSKAALQGVSLSLETGLPPETEVEADRWKIMQVLFNLLDNAVKFTPAGGSVEINARLIRDEGGDELSVRICNAGERPSSVVISVTDNGIGIKEEDMPILFGQFQQIEMPFTKKYRGIGLGLLLAKKLVELHGGRIWMESEFGKGSTCSFVLPMNWVTES